MNGGYLGSDYLQDGNTRSSGIKTVKYAFDTIPTGKYEVLVHWTSGTNRATNARFDIVTSSGVKSTFVNQQINGGTWVSLGTYDLNP